MANKFSKIKRDLKKLSCKYKFDKDDVKKIKVVAWEIEQKLRR